MKRQNSKKLGSLTKRSVPSDLMKSRLKGNIQERFQTPVAKQAVIKKPKSEMLKAASLLRGANPLVGLARIGVNKGLKSQKIAPGMFPKKPSKKIPAANKSVFRGK